MDNYITIRIPEATTSAKIRRKSAYPQDKNMQLTSISQFSIGLILLLLTNVTNGQQVGVDICACTPRVYEMTLDFSLTCPPILVDIGEGVIEGSCLITSFDNPEVTDLVPVAVSSVQFIELDQGGTPLSVTQETGDYRNGSVLIYRSVSERGIVPLAFQTRAIGMNDDGDTLIMQWALTYNNDCGIFPILKEGQSVGWTIFTDLTNPLQTVCPIGEADFCEACKTSEECYEADACTFRDSATGLWSGIAETCNAGELCDECFPDSPCYRGDQTVTAIPTRMNSTMPTEMRELSATPTKMQSMVPTEKHSALPTESTVTPTRKPTEVPTKEPSTMPNVMHSAMPSEKHSSAPTDMPTTASPTDMPNNEPTNEPTNMPTNIPTVEPTNIPTEEPTKMPTKMTTKEPTKMPTKEPTKMPTEEPTKMPTEVPTKIPSRAPDLLTDRPSIPRKKRRSRAKNSQISSNDNLEQREEELFEKNESEREDVSTDINGSNDDQIERGDDLLAQEDSQKIRDGARDSTDSIEREVRDSMDSIESEVMHTGRSGKDDTNDDDDDLLERDNLLAQEDPSENAMDGATDSMDSIEREVRDSMEVEEDENTQSHYDTNRSTHVSMDIGGTGSVDNYNNDDDLLESGDNLLARDDPSENAIDGATDTVESIEQEVRDSMEEEQEENVQSYYDADRSTHVSMDMGRSGSDDNNISDDDLLKRDDLLAQEDPSENTMDGATDSIDSIEREVGDSMEEEEEENKQSHNDTEISGNDDNNNNNDDLLENGDNLLEQEDPMSEGGNFSQDLNDFKYEFVAMEEELNEEILSDHNSVDSDEHGEEMLAMEENFGTDMLAMEEDLNTLNDLYARKGGKGGKGGKGEGKRKKSKGKSDYYAKSRSKSYIKRNKGKKYNDSMDGADNLYSGRKKEGKKSKKMMKRSQRFIRNR